MAFLAESGERKFFFHSHYIGNNQGLKEWVLISTDLLATITTPGYIDVPYYQAISVGDAIRVFRVTNRNDLSTILSEHRLIVVAKSGSTVTVSEYLAVGDSGLFLNLRSFGASGDGSTSDTDALSDAFEAATETGKAIYVPPTEDSYLTAGGLTVPATVMMFGRGVGSKIKLTDDSTNSLFDLSTNDNISFENLELVGNSATELTDTGSSAIKCSSGASGIRVAGCNINHWSRHGLSLDGVTDAVIDRNIVEDSYWGAGILVSTTTQSANVSIQNNTVRRTQMGNIHGFFGVSGLRVIGNFCDGSDAGVGSGGGGSVADNITFYQEDADGALLDAVIANNVCRNSGNHGMHIGGDRLVITGNSVYNPTNGGLSLFKADNSTPDDAENLTVSGNTLVFADPTVNTAEGINIRNFKNFSVTGNTVVNPFDGIQINGINTASYGCKTGVITGNTIENYGRYGVWTRNLAQGLSIFGNYLNANAAETTQDIREDLAGGAVSSDNFIFNNLSFNADTVFGQMLRAPGATALLFGNQEGEHVRIGSSTSLIANGLTLAGNVAGSAPSIAARGSDTNVALALSGKGIGVVSSLSPHKMVNYTVATVPSASGIPGAAIYVSNEAGGAVLAFSDGTNWKRVTDLATIS